MPKYYILRPVKITGHGMTRIGDVIEMPDDRGSKLCTAKAGMLIDGKLDFDHEQAHQKYTTSDGTTCPGGSTIAKIGDDTGGLIHWAWQQGMDGKDYKAVRDKAAHAGLLAHHMVEAFFLKKEPTYEQFSEVDRVKANWAFRKFVEWQSEQELGWDASIIKPEMQFVSEAHRYGGTLDAPYRGADGKAVLVDWKTSKAIYNSFVFQLSGYENLWNEHNPNDKIARRAIVRIGKQAETGDFEVRWYGDAQIKNAFEIFKAKNNLWWTMKRCKL